MIKKILKTTDPYTAILKNQKTIGANQAAGIKTRTILLTLSTICDITSVSNKLNKNLFVISLDFLNKLIELIVIL